MDNDNLAGELELRRLMQGADIPLDKVREEVCPGCPYRTPFCDFHMALSLDIPGARFTCKGMRAYVTRSN